MNVKKSVVGMKLRLFDLHIRFPRGNLQAILRQCYYLVEIKKLTSSLLMTSIYFRPAVALVALCFLPDFAFAQAAEQNATSKSEQKPTQAAKMAAPAVNEITQAAVKNGTLSCASRINQVSGF